MRVGHKKTRQYVKKRKRAHFRKKKNIVIYAYLIVF